MEAGKHAPYNRGQNPRQQERHDQGDHQCGEPGQEVCKPSKKTGR
jgi:hypothetical protein